MNRLVSRTTDAKAVYVRAGLIVLPIVLLFAIVYRACVLPTPAEQYQMIYHIDILEDSVLIEDHKEYAFDGENLRYTVFRVDRKNMNIKLSGMMNFNKNNIYKEVVQQYRDEIDVLPSKNDSLYGTIMYNGRRRLLILYNLDLELAYLFEKQV